MTIGALLITLTIGGLLYERQKAHLQDVQNQLANAEAANAAAISTIGLLQEHAAKQAAAIAASQQRLRSLSARLNDVRQSVLAATDSDNGAIAPVLRRTLERLQ